jgi:uncharacterized membrane protein YqiK
MTSPFVVPLDGSLPLLSVLALTGVLFLFVVYNCIAIAKGNEIITLERRWFGAAMPDGRTVALSNEVGVQARTLGPGVHLLIPFIYHTQKHRFVVIGTDQIGLVRACTGASIPSGEFFAKPVACSLFQDGEAFLRGGGEKGPQVLILPPGEHRINPHLFTVDVTNAVIVTDAQVGLVESVGGKPCDAGRIFATPVSCDNFQDGAAFLANGGQKGPQTAILPPGKYRINTALFKVENHPVTIIPGGTIGLVSAMDGARIPDGRLLANKVEGHSNFEKGDTFMSAGGEKGRQIDVLMPGTYRINTDLFEVSTPVAWTNVGPDEVGIVIVQEGKPILDPTKIAADEIDLGLHNNFQNPSAFLAAGGQKGLQIPVLRSGNYAINPWFAQILKKPMTEVKIGECAVVTSFVGEEGEDMTDAKVNAKIVKNGKKGIWADPLGPGMHALNTKVCKVDIVPTTQILLNWADNESSAHKFDSNLKTITLRTSDAFNVDMDVSVIIHIAMADAPKVVANLGSVTNMISQVLEPAISSHFRNAAQAVQALDLYTKRAELQEKAKLHLQDVLKGHHIESKDTMIADVVLPPELTKTVTDRQIAEQERKTYATQKQAQDERKVLENAKAQADMQKRVVESERGVEISKNLADAAIKAAEGEAKATELKADGTAKATKLNADADAEKERKTGIARADVILAQGESTAKAYKLSVDAMGPVFGQLKIVEQIASNHIKLIPDVLISGGGGQGGGGANLENLLGIALIDKLTGKDTRALIAGDKPRPTER